METQDQLITCQDCGQPFNFTAGEQDYYRERGFVAPKRCKECRSQRKRERSGMNPESSRQPRELYDAVCTLCSATTQVPFRPSPGRAVYCRPCFDAQRTQRL